MRFYFHVSNLFVTAEDHEGVELPSFAAALEKGGRIAKEPLDDPDAASFDGGSVNIVGSTGLLFIPLPIVRAKPLHALN